MKRLGLICLLMGFWYCADAQIRTISREKLESVNTPLLSSDAQALKFELTHIAAGQMSEEDGVQTFVYPFQNIGNDTIVIKRLVSTCSCATALCEKKTVPPGDKSEIVVRYNPKGHPGRFERKVFVYTDDSQSPSAILRLSVEVERGKGFEGLYPISMGSIRLRRNEIVVDREVKTVEKCVFVNVNDAPLRLMCEKAMLPSCLNFRVEPEVVNVGQEGEIIIEYDPAKGGARDKMPVILKGLGVPPSQSTINVVIKEK